MACSLHKDRAMEHIGRRIHPSPVPPGYAHRLQAEHASLEQTAEGLLVLMEAGDWRICNSAWCQLAADLERHMEYEEDRLFPEFARSSPAAAGLIAELRAEHSVLRRQLDQLSIDMELHQARGEGVRSFVATLKEHAQREAGAFYRWLAQTQGIGG